MVVSLRTRPGSPEWWRDRLLPELDKRAKLVKERRRWVDGEHELPDPPSGMQAEAFAEAKAAFKSLSQMGVTNFLPMISRAPANRLTILGFTMGAVDDSGRRQNDEVVGRAWQVNHLDSESKVLHATVFDTGQAAVIVYPGDPEVSVTCEDPAEVIVAYEAGNRWRRTAALKRWLADDGRVYVTLYLPDAIWKWQTRSTRPEFGLATMGVNDWVQRQPTDDEAWPLPNLMGEVPVVEFAVNTTLQARPFGGGRPEYHGVLPIQRRINKTVFDRLATAEAQAFRQRYAIGWNPPIDPDTGKPDPRVMFRASRSQLGLFPEGVEVGEFEQADFSPFLKAVEDDARWMATITYTPPSFMPVDLKNLGAETIAQTNAGFFGKTIGHRDNLGESWEEVRRLILKAKADRRADDPLAQIVWEDIEVHTLGEKVDFAMKLKGLEVPVEEIWARLPGVTQADIARWAKARRAQALEASAGAALEGLIGGDGGTPAGDEPPAG